MPNDAKATPVAIEPEGDWYGLYKSGSRDDHLFDPASTRHPAKMSLALTNKILDQMLEWGWIETGSLVVDPFGGRGTSILAWLARHPANRGFSLELEPHFVEMQQKNKEHAQRRLHRELAWVILQGDSRRFDEYYAEGKAASVLSAPYGNQQGGGGKSEQSVQDGRLPASLGAAHRDHREKQRSLGQIGNLPDSAITSAPYETAVQDKSGIDPTKFRTQGGRYGQTSQAVAGGYQSTASVLSAPYAAAENRRAAGKVQEGEVSDAITRAYDATNHGQTAGNIANLPDACVTSAPWEASLNNRGGITGPKDTSRLMDADYTDPAAAVTSAPFEDSLASDDPEKRGGFLKSDPKRRNDPGLTATYGDAAAVTSAPFGEARSQDIGKIGREGLNSPDQSGAALRPWDRAYVKTGTEGQIGDLPEPTGQIGVLQSETYAQACGLVYASLAKAGIRYVASVTKDPTRAGKLRPLRLLTIQLFEAAGYRLVAWRRAHLFATQEEEDERMGQPSLFGEDVEGSKRLVGRLSFFRRLACARGGIAAKHEDALFFELRNDEV